MGDVDSAVSASPFTSKRVREVDEEESASIDALTQHQDKKIKQEDITSYDNENDDYSDVIPEIGVTSIAMALEYRAMKKRHLSLDNELEMERQVRGAVQGGK